MKNNSFTFRSSWFDAISDQPDNVRLAVMDAICRYAIYGEVPQDLDPVARMAFVLIRAEIDGAAARRKQRTKPAQMEANAEPQTATVTAVPADTAADSTTEANATTEATGDFDANFDTVAEKLRNNPTCREWLKTRLNVRDIDVALSEFKTHIRNSGRTAEFAGGTMSVTDFYKLMVSAIDERVFSSRAVSRYL